MLIVRPAAPDDLDALLDLSSATGPGMTSMPADRTMWRRRLAATEHTFTKDAPESAGTYFMVLVDTPTGRIVGSTAIYAGVGMKRPFYSYKVSTLVNYSSHLDRTVTHQVLHLVNDYTGVTEIGSLYLDPEFRRDGNGAFLSRSRYLLLRSMRARFSDTVIAEMRGWQDADGNSPFWEHLGKKFFGIGFQNADYMNAVDGTQFISDLMPRYPIYVDLLPESARKVIGKPHDDSAKALSLLAREGFHFADYVDIFDGGPTVQCRTDDIESVRRTRAEIVADIVDDSAVANAAVHVICNDDIGRYRIVRQGVAFDERGVILGNSCADALGCEVGATVFLFES